MNLTKKAKVAKVPDIEKDKENEEKTEAEATELEKEQKKLRRAKKPLSVLPEVVEVPQEIGEAIEAILFAAGHAVAYTTLARVLSMSLGEATQMVYSYSLLYNESTTPRGVIMLTFDDCCQLCTKQQFLPYIREALGIRRNGNLSNSSIETLAVIAYNQPVTRSYVDTVRGVDSSYAVGSLLERGLIESKGRLDAPGRPMLYGTTATFLRCFGLSSLTELPGVSSEEAAEMLSKISKQLEIDLVDTNQVTIEMPEEGEDSEEERTPDPTAAAIGETPELIEE